MKAIELVRKAASLGSSLRGAGERRGAVALAGRAVALRVVRATTVVARRMQDLPIPKPRPAERLALASAASQLRAMADVADLGGETTRDPEIEAALGALVVETLALVDKVLAAEPELAGSRERALPHASETKPTGDGASHDIPTKVIF